MVAVAEVFSVYVDEYRNEGTSPRLAEVAYKRDLTSGTDLHGIPNLAAQHRVICDDRCGELGPEIPEDENGSEFEGLVTMEELERTGVRGKLGTVQNACRAKRWKAQSSVIEVIEIAASVGAGRKEKGALERSSAKMIGVMGRMRTKLDKARLAVQVVKVRVKVLKAEVEHLKGVV